MSFSRPQKARQVQVKNKNTHDARRLRNGASKAGIKRVIVIDSTTTQMEVDKLQRAHWLGKFVQDYKAEVLHLYSTAPDKTYLAACTMEMLTERLHSIHESRCNNCQEVLGVRDVRSVAQAETTAAANVAIMANKYSEVTTRSVADIEIVEDSTMAAIVNVDETAEKVLQEIISTANELSLQAQKTLESLSGISELRNELLEVEQKYKELLKGLGLSQ